MTHFILRHALPPARNPDKCGRRPPPEQPAQLFLDGFGQFVVVPVENRLLARSAEETAQNNVRIGHSEGEFGPHEGASRQCLALASRNEEAEARRHGAAVGSPIAQSQGQRRAIVNALKQLREFAMDRRKQFTHRPGRTSADHVPCLDPFAVDPGAKVTSCPLNGFDAPGDNFGRGPETALEFSG
jgi:hypothetical protein